MNIFDNTLPSAANYNTVKADFEIIEAEILKVANKSYDILMHIYILFAIYLAYPIRSL